MNQRSTAFLSALTALIIAISGLVGIVIGNSTSGTTTVPAPSLTSGPVDTSTALGGKKVETPKKVLAPVLQSDAGHHDDLRSEGPASLVKKINKASNKLNPDAPSYTGPVPLASAYQPGCVTRQVRYFSTRNGTKPSLIVLHYTVSRNIVGWSDVNAIFDFFNRAATQANSNYVYDNEGHCILMVPEALKAWAQAGFNSATACSFEVVNTGFEPTYIGAPGGVGERNLARGVHDCAARWHIPLQRGAISGCVPTRAGVLDHTTLGACGGGHADIGRWHGDGTIERIIREAASGGHVVPVVLPPSKHARALCTQLNHIRRQTADYERKYHIQPVTPITKKQGAKADKLRRALKKSYKCTVGPPHKPGTLVRK